MWEWVNLNENSPVLLDIFQLIGMRISDLINMARDHDDVCINTKRYMVLYTESLVVWKSIESKKNPEILDKTLLNQLKSVMI